jgi:acyl-CoA thioesterase FadM
MEILRQEVHRPADGKHLATGEVVACCVKAREDGTYRSFPLPEEMVAALKRYLVPAEAGGAS